MGYKDDRLQQAHNKGQSDGSANTFSKPHRIDPWDTAVFGEKKVSQWRAENDAYRKGHRNGSNHR
ncbi:MAG: hypothetical protein AAFN13_07970 [Bacteroidota bacterium]